MDFSLRIRVNVDHVCLGAVCHGLGVCHAATSIYLAGNRNTFKHSQCYTRNIDMESESNDWLIRVLTNRDMFFRV